MDDPFPVGGTDVSLFTHKPICYGYTSVKNVQRYFPLCFYCNLCWTKIRGYYMPLCFTFFMLVTTTDKRIELIMDIEFDVIAGVECWQGIQAELTQPTFLLRKFQFYKSCAFNGHSCTVS
jgi:hypothetical protein